MTMRGLVLTLLLVPLVAVAQRGPPTRTQTQTQTQTPGLNQTQTQMQDTTRADTLLVGTQDSLQPPAIPTATVAAVRDSLALAPSAPLTWQTLAGYAITIALGLFTPWIMTRLEGVWRWLDDQPATTKRIMVGAITGLVTSICAILSREFPWFPWNPEPVNALIAMGIAMSAKAGDTANTANAIIHNTQESKSPKPPSV